MTTQTTPTMTILLLCYVLPHIPISIAGFIFAVATQSLGLGVWAAVTGVLCVLIWRHQGYRHDVRKMFDEVLNA